jgi:manganese efflux pump family protein
MMSIFALGLALSLDNLRVVTALAAAGATRRVTVRVVGAFVVFEAVTPLIGLLIGDASRAAVEPWAELTGVIALAGAGLYILITAVGSSSGEALPDKTWFVVGLPLSLSIDNLIAGVGLGLLAAPPLTVGLAFAAATAITCTVGLILGELAGRLHRGLSQIAAGLALVLSSILEFA